MKTFAILIDGGIEPEGEPAASLQFEALCGEEVWVHALRAFVTAPEVDKIVIVSARGREERFRTGVARHGFDKVSRIVTGGPDRFDAVRNALGSIAAEPDDKILLSDTLRPCLTADVIARCCRTLETHSCCDIGLPVVGPALVVEDGVVTAALSEDRLVVRQGPEGGRFGVLTEVLDRLAPVGRDGRGGGDRSFATLAEACRALIGAEIALVEGNDKNVRILGRTDLAVAEAYMTGIGVWSGREPGGSGS